MHSYVAALLRFIAIITLSTFPSWKEEDDDGSENGSERSLKPFSVLPASHFALITSVIGTRFGFISVLRQHIHSTSIATMAKVLTHGAVSCHVRGAALEWVSVGAAAFAAIAMIRSIENIQVLIE
jgi:hypothetical protein